jgi:hypothetical protein
VSGGQLLFCIDNTSAISDIAPAMSALTGYIGQTYGYATTQKVYYEEGINFAATSYRYSTVPPECDEPPIKEIFDIKRRFEHCVLNYNFPKTKP